MTASSPAGTGIDPVTLTVAANHLVAISEEMGLAMKRTAYSPVFSEANDFSCAVFDAEGEMIGQGNFCPAQLGAMTFALRWIIDELGIDALGPGDVFLHNDPYSGMNHLPEHMVVKAVFAGDERVGIVACIGHMAEVGGLAAGGFPGDAQEVFHEGLRLPPVRIVKAGRDDADLWRVILANNRTPRVSQGDLRAMIGSLHVGGERLLRFVERHGVENLRGITEALKWHAEQQMRRALQALPQGTFSADELIIDNDGWVDEPVRVRVAITIAGGRLIADFTGSDPQCRGSCNCTLVATIGAVYCAVLHITDSDIPANAGRYRPLEVIAPEGSVVNASYPAATVGGNSEVQPHLVTLIWKALAPAVPTLVAAGASETAMLVTFGGRYPATGEFFSNLMLEGEGWGGSAQGDGYDVVTGVNSNCVVTPVEVLETRFPLIHREFRLNENSGGAGEARGGLGTIRTVELRVPMTVSCYHSSERLLPWGLFGGEEGTLSSFVVKRPSDSDFADFKTRFGVRCASKFTNVRLPAGTLLRMVVGGGGGYGPPERRQPHMIARDLDAGLYDERYVHAHFPDQASAALAIRDELRVAARKAEG